MKRAKRVSAVLTAFVLQMTLLLPLLTFQADAGTFLLYWPLPASSTVTAGFDDGRGHGAIDIGADKGDPVIAAGPGYVTSTYSGCTHNFGKSYNCCYSLGNHVRIKHDGSVNGSSYSTRYGHLSEVYVKEGDYVQAGQVIGTAGSTGYSTGNHLDFKFYVGDEVTDPAPYLQVPSDIHYNGSDWSNNGAYVQRLKSYAAVNTTYGGPASSTAPPSSGGTPSTGGTVVTSGQLYVEKYSYPSLMKRGARDAGVSGTIRSDSTIVNVTVQIITPGNRVVRSQVKAPNSTSFDLATISSALDFPSLAPGDYIYEVFATNQTGEQRLISRSFIVTNGADIIIVDNTLPDALRPGQSFSVRGEVISINSLTNVTVAVLNEEGKAVLSQSIAPLSNTFDLQRVDAALTFNKLTEGVYTYRITATDSEGNRETLVDRSFYVSDKKLITGEVTVSGLGWLGSSSAVLSSPYTYATLRADVQIDPEGTPLSYQWYADDMPIAGATEPTYAVTSDKLGKRLSVSVTATGGGCFGTVRSEQTRPVQDKYSIIGDFMTNLTGRPTEYIIDLKTQTISPALANTNCNELLEKITFSATFNGVYDKDGKKKDGMDTVRTGDYVRSGIGQITISRYFVVVLGDVNGDGKVTTADARCILRHAAKLETIDTAWALRAANADRLESVTSADARAVLRAAARLENLSAK